MIKSEQIVGVVYKLEKYRNELIKAAVILFITSLLSYYKSTDVVNILGKPLNNQPLFFLTPVDGIMVRVKIALLGGIICSFPIISYRIVYLMPASVTKKTKRLIYFLILPFMLIAFTAGVAFAYFLVLPNTMSFLLSCGNEFMKPTIRGSDYFSFVIILLVAIGVIFELPLILVALSRTGIVSYKMLSSKRRIAILLIVIVVALITPTPDVFTLAVVGLPMVFLYEISVWWIFLLERKNKKLSVSLNE